MATKFTASQSVEIAVPQQPIPIQHYLRQPQRLVNALVDNNRIQQLSEEVFRLKMRPLTFMSLSIQPTVDMKVWAESNGTIYLRSIGCEILGFEYINQRFTLNLKGYLSPKELQYWYSPRRKSRFRSAGGSATAIFLHSQADFRSNRQWFAQECAVDS